MTSVLSNIKSHFYQNLINFPGWRSSRKIVVIESDDWGSIRMPSTEIYDKFKSRGLDLSNTDYNRIDTLECNDDLSFLFDVLYSIKDNHGSHPVITANVVVGNPDFTRIKESDYTAYYFEPVTETLKWYPNREKVHFLWKEGNLNGIFHPQFHGREHVNVVRWMNALAGRTPEILYTFDHKTTFSGDGDYNFMEVLDYNSAGDLLKMQESLTEGLDMFEDIFGYRSVSFIPPCYTWDSKIEKTLYEGGVRYIQGLVVQSLPTGTFGKYGKRLHFMGERNSIGLRFLIRNCFFEPSLWKTNDSVGECLNRIAVAFRWHKPAVICAHRINFVGSLDTENRSRNLILFSDLLNRIIKIWPDVEFMTSDQLGDVISGEVVS